MAVLNVNEKPFYLNEDDINWVEKTFDSLTVKEKVGQLFCPMVEFMDNEAIEKVLDEIKPGGNGNIAEELFRMVANSNWSLAELRRETESLEDVFRQLTSSDSQVTEEE